MVSEVPSGGGGGGESILLWNQNPFVKSVDLLPPPPPSGRDGREGSNRCHQNAVPDAASPGTMSTWKECGGGICDLAHSFALPWRCEFEVPAIRHMKRNTIGLDAGGDQGVRCPTMQPRQRHRLIRGVGIAVARADAIGVEQNALPIDRHLARVDPVTTLGLGDGDDDVAT